MAEKEIQGNINGISKTILSQIQSLSDVSLSRDVFISEELAQLMAQFSSAINREISVLIGRNGTIEDISIGEFGRAEIPLLTTKRSLLRLNGIRCIHTHLNGSGRLSDVDYATLSDAKLDAMAAIGVHNGNVIDLHAAFLTENHMIYHNIGPLSPTDFDAIELMQAIEDSDRHIGREKIHELSKEQEFAMLFGMDEEGLEELKELAQTAGAKVLSVEIQNRAIPDRATYIGRGKVEEIKQKINSLLIDLLIINADITPIQQRNLEERLGIKIVDRTALILDIFAMRAKSKEGCLQVELAQMKYLLPRLIGKGMILSRQGGSAGGAGIASRGPGETKLELDRRHIRRRIHALEEEIKQLEKQRAYRRSKRASSGTPTLALVGYTNAGKSTLLNALTGANAYVENKLFATLDPLTRRADINGKELIFTDTVGFVKDLPHDLVTAFRSTLEEVTQADILLHVVDGSNPQRMEQIRVVKEVLASLDAAEKPTLFICNKIDLMNQKSPGTMIPVSAHTGQGLEALKKAIEEMLSKMWKRETLHIPYARSEIVSILHENGTVFSEEYKDEEMVFEVELPEAVLQQIKDKLSI